MIQNELLNKINEIISQMKDFNEEINIKYNITEQMNKMFNVLKSTYDILINYTQNFLDDINEYDDILALYTYISGSTHTIRQLNKYLKDDNEKYKEKIINKFNSTNDKSMEKILKMQNQKKNKNNNIYQIYNNNINNNKYIFDKNNNNNKTKINLNYTKNNYKSKRRLSSHSERGTVTKSIINKEIQKFKKILNNFNKTYLNKDYLKIQSNWLKEESKINRYLINSGRTIELSVLKLASIITQDKMNSLEEILYFKHKQISNHVNKFLNLTSNLTQNYLLLLENSSETLDITFKDVNQIIIVDFEVLKELITGQITEMKNIKEKNEEIEGNERLYELFSKGDFYQPIGIKFSNFSNDIKNPINLTKSKTITQYYNLLKYTKYKLFNDTEKKYDGINHIFQEAKKNFFYKRRIEESSSSSNKDSNSNSNNEGKNDKNNNNDKNKKKDDPNMEMGMEYDIMLGKLSFEFSYCLSNDFDLKEIIIPIIGIFNIVLEPEIELGFCFSLGIEAKVHKKILNTEYIINKSEIKGNEEEEDEDDDDDDTKLELKVWGKAEESLSVSAGFVFFNTEIFYMAFLAGIKGLL